MRYAMVWMRGVRRMGKKSSRPRKKDGTTLGNGEPWVLNDGGYYFHECCDCGNTHLILCDIVDGNKVKLRFYNDDFQTDIVHKKTKKKS